MRAKGFTKEKVSYFFDQILEPQLTKINYDPARIFNVDETGVTIVQQKMTKVLCLKGQKQVGGISSAERGSLVTLVFCMNAAGLFVPPMFIFPRVNMKKELEDRAPAGSTFGTHKSGWIQLHLFNKWFKHFIKYINANKEKPVILILDGHFSHTRNLELIDLARENGIILISIPPHTSHKLQPLDVGFMSPFKKYYAEEIETWLRAHGGRMVTAYQISELVGKAYLRSASLQVSVNSFKKCGIYPLNKNLFKDDDFAVKNQESNTTEAIDNEICTPIVLNPNNLLLSAEIIMPVSSINSSGKKNCRKETKPMVLTASPYKQRFEQANTTNADTPANKKRCNSKQKIKKKQCK